MLDFLSNIWDAIRSVPFLIADFGVMIVNGFIAAVAGLASVVMALLPGLPDTPTAPSGGILGLINWVVPLGPLLAGFGILVTAWVIWLGIRVALRWVKAA